MASRQSGALKPRIGLPSSDTIEVFEEVRKVVFEKVSVRVRGKRRLMTQLEAYHQTLTDQAARGQQSAISEQLYIMRKLEKASILARAEFIPGRAEFLESLELHQRMSRYAQNLIGVVFLFMQPEMKTAYEKVHGPLKNFYDLKPYYLDLTSGCKSYIRIMKRIIRNRKSAEYVVGRGKPPRETRWQKGVSGNPSGSRRKDAWDGIREGLCSEIVLTDAEGRKIKSTKVAASCRQLFKQAIKDEPGSRRTLRRYIDVLEELNILKEPPASPPKPRRKRKGTEEDIKKRYQMMTMLIVGVKRSMIELYNKHYGSIPPFKTNVEHFIAVMNVPREDLPAWVYEDAGSTAPAERQARPASNDDIEDYEAGIMDATARAEMDALTLDEQALQPTEEILSMPRKGARSRPPAPRPRKSRSKE